MEQTALVSPTMNAPAEAQSGGGIGLRQAIEIVRVYWRRSLIAAGVVMMLAVLVAMSLPRTYTANAIVMVNYEVNDPLGGREYPISLLSSYIATQIDLMQSPRVLIAVVERLHLQNIERYASGYKGDPEGLTAYVADNVAKKLTVTQGTGENQLITIGFSSIDPVEAATVANADVDVYLEQAAAGYAVPASEYVQRYARELDVLKDNVTRTQDELTRFRQQNKMLEDQGSSMNEVALLQSMQQKLSDARSARSAAEARLSSSSASSTDVLNSSLVQTLKSRLASENERMTTMSASLGRRHPDVVQLQTEIDATRHQLDSEIQHYNENAADDVRAARDLEQKLSADVDQERTKVLQMQQLRDQAQNLQLQLESAQTVYKHALEGYDPVIAASTGKYTNVNIISRAIKPTTPNKGKKVKVVGIGLFLALAVGFGGAFGYELLLNRRVRCADDLEIGNGLPVLAEIGTLPGIGFEP